MKIIIINGPNLNLLGKRETEIYGEQGFDEKLRQLSSEFPNVEIAYFQSNHEGELIDKIHEVGFSYDGIVLNAAAYTHTSIAISDAIAAIETSVVEVHITNVYSRERYRRHSFISKNCKGVIVGFGLNGYSMAIQSFL